MAKTLAALSSLLLLLGCSSSPVLQTEGVNQHLTAKQVADAGYGMAGKRVVWGGVIINSSNLKNGSRLEILSYPLNKRLRPQIDKLAGSRFFAYQQGYLETVDYAAGRQVTLVGSIRGNEEAQLGEHNYRYPSLNIEQLHLWSQKNQDSEPRVRFGFGIILHN